MENFKEIHHKIANDVFKVALSLLVDIIGYFLPGFDVKLVVRILYLD